MRLATLCEEKYDYCSTQFNIDDPKILKLINKIDDNDLAEDGKEDQPHVTIKFGIYEIDPSKIAKAVKGFGIVKLKLGKISLFESNEHDVVKIDIHSPKLHRLNKLICSKFKHDDTYPEYIPHLTLAYVKPGLGDKYVGKHDLIGKSYEFEEFMFSDRDGNLTKIPLANINYIERV